MVKALFISGALVALAAPIASAAPSDPRASIETMLAGYEHVPTAADWARLGEPDAVVAVLVDLTRTGRTLTAARATSSLAHFPRPEVRSFLAARVADPTLRATLRGKAAIALARAFGDAVAPTIAPLFASPDPDLREDAIRAFAPFTSIAAEAFLRSRAGMDPASRLAERMRATADRIAGARARRMLITPSGPGLLLAPDLDPTLGSDRTVEVEIEDPGPVLR